nr:hypothetical protein [uncultured Mediterranean phage uvMED]
MRIDIRTNIKEVTRGLTRIQKKQIPFAAANALNTTAFSMHKALKKQTKQKFEHAANYTQKAFRVDKAKKKNLVAYIYVHETREDYFKYQVDGGVRPPKNTAIVIANDKNANDIRQHPSGNITKGAYNKLKKDKKKYFFGKPKGNQGSEGIWERYGREATGTLSGAKIRQVAKLTKFGKYKALFPFESIGQGVAFSRKNGFESNFAKAMKFALRTAK